MAATASLKPSYVVDFSTEELAFLLGALSIPRLPGFTVPDDFDGRAASVAGRSLLARGLATLTNEDIYLIEEKMAAIVASGVTFSSMLHIAREAEAEPSREHWFYMAPNLTVMHSKPQPGVERLQTIPDGMSFLLMLASAMELPMHSVFDEPYSLTVEQVLIEQARDLVLDGQNTAAFYMLRDKVGDDDFAMAVIYPRQRIGFSISRPAQGYIVAGMVLDTDGANWLLRQDGDILHVTCLDSRGVLDFIADCLVA